MHSSDFPLCVSPDVDEAKKNELKEQLINYDRTLLVAGAYPRHFHVTFFLRDAWLSLHVYEVLACAA